MCAPVDWFLCLSPPQTNIPNTPLPRLVDMGQCNDAYSAIVVADALAKAFNTDVNVSVNASKGGCCPQGRLR